MLIASPHNIKNKPPVLPISINKVPVPRVKCYKCLGVILGEKLNWEHHVEMITKKLMQALQ